MFPPRAWIPANADAFTVPLLAVAASGTVAGARLSSLNSAAKTYSIGIAIGADMNCFSRDDLVAATLGTNYLLHARHHKGDTAYGFDSDVEGAIYTVSNPAWPNVAGIGATLAALAVQGTNQFTALAGGGAPTVNWTILN